MNVGKVIKLRINPTYQQSQQLYDTMVEYTRVCNEVSQWIFDNDFIFSHKQLNNALYRHFRITSCLSAHMVQNTFRTVCARYKTVQTQLKKRPIMYKQGNKLKSLKDMNNHVMYKDIDWLQKPIRFIVPHKIMSRRDSFQHILSVALIKNHDLVAAEELRSKNLLKNHALAMSISDTGWRSFLSKLEYKAKLYGKIFITVDPKNTTQTCSACGHIMSGEQKLTLKDREWICPKCGTHHIRDVNATKNILSKALQSV